MKIGFFDSGMGGTTVLKESLKMLPDEDYIYFADTFHVPYGEKTKDEVKQYIFEAVDFIARCGIKTLVVACNTATSIAIKDLREKYCFPILGMEPAVKPAVVRTNGSGKRVIVFATSLTLKESKFHQLVSQVDHNNIVDYMALPELVTFAESLEFREEVVVPYLKEKLSSIDIEQYGTVVLGCTHFPIYRPCFKKMFPENVDIIDGAKGTVRHLQNIIADAGISGGGCGKIDFYSSGNNAADSLKFQKVMEYLDSME